MSAVAGDPILEVEDLNIHIRHAYGNTPVVSGVSFSVLEGENLGIVGESGCGKTLTGLSVIGLLPAPGGGHGLHPLEGPGCAPACLPRSAAT